MRVKDVLSLEPEIQKILQLGLARDLVIDGHCPGLSGTELNTFIEAGIGSYHSRLDSESFEEMTRLGISVQVQETWLTPDLVRTIGRKNSSIPNFMFVTDDVSPGYIYEHGHLDHLLRRAIEYGMDPIEAIRRVTVFPAQWLRLHSLGAIGLGKLADLVIFEDLETLNVETVITNGRVVVREGELVVLIKMASSALAPLRSSVKADIPKEYAFRIQAPIWEGKIPVRVIEIIRETTETKLCIEELPVVEGSISLEGYSDLNMILVFHRHGKAKKHGKGLLKGLGLAHGAVASTLAHDSHNLLVIGREPHDMRLAAVPLRDTGGGIIVVRDERILATLCLPIAGIMSDQSVEDVVRAFSHLENMVRRLGVYHRKPVQLITFLSLAVSPDIALTDMGLVDVNNQTFLDLFPG